MSTTLATTGSEFEIGPGNQANWSVTALADGNAVAVWSNSDVGGPSIQAAILTSTGTILNSFEVTRNADAAYASVTSLSSGNFVVAYSAQAADGDTETTRFQIFTPDGTPFGSETILPYGALGSEATFPNITSMSDGGFLISYAVSVQGGSGITMDRFDAGGTQIWGPKAAATLYTNTLDSQTAPHATGLADGTFALTWLLQNNVGSGTHLKVQVYDGLGNASGPQTPIDLLGNSTDYSDEFASIATLSNGNFVLAYGNGANYSQIYAQLFSPDGTPSGDPILVSSNNPANGEPAFNPTVTGVADAKFVVSWSTYSTPGATSYDIHSRAFDASGSPFSDEIVSSQLLTGAQFVPQMATLDPEHVMLTFQDSGGVSPTAAIAGQLLTVACYCRDTLITTAHGERPVQSLEIGDRLMTKSGELRPIKWIGRRGYLGRFALAQKDILPICFKAGSLGEGVPRRDLWVSPHHAMYLEGCLIEARDLVNGVSVVQAEHVDQVEYFHIELNSHDVIVAEGALSESFIDDDSRGMFHNAHEYRALYPDASAGPAQYCAPRQNDGYAVEAARAGIETRAGLRSEVAQDLLRLRGNVDVVSAAKIAGWAQNAECPDVPVCLDIYAGERLIGQVLANRYRADLKRAGIGSGCHSFEFIPSEAMIVDPQSVEVRRSLDGAVLSIAIMVPRSLAMAS